jgi:hypothetical protein
MVPQAASDLSPPFHDGICCVSMLADTLVAGVAERKAD